MRVFGMVNSAPDFDRHPAVVNGFMELPTGPGLGVELNEELIARWRVD